MKICEPAKVYLGISVLFILIGFLSKSISVYALLLKTFFVFLWVWVLSILCKKKMKELAWAFVLLPFITIGSAVIYGNKSYREGNTSELGGSYSQSCENVRIDNGRILGECMRRDRSMSNINQPMSDVNNCMSNVVNNNGSLGCGAESRSFMGLVPPEHPSLLDQDTSPMD